MVTATFRLCEELNDFLPPSRRHWEFSVACAEGATTKPMIEAFGVPHTVVEPILLNRDSAGFDRLLQDKDRAAVYLLRHTDARLALGQPLASLRRKGSRRVVNAVVSTPLLIGASGHFRPVARHLGAKVGAGEAAVTTKEVEFAMDTGQIAACEAKPEMPELYFSQDLSGCGWCMRKGRYRSIGLGMERARRLTGALERFCSFLEPGGRIPPDIPDRFHGHAYLLYGHSKRRLLDDSVLLVGDAAGLACARGGEGILPAVESGLMAAATALQASGDYRGERLAPYRERLSARYGDAPVSAASREAGSLRKGLGRLLLRSRWPTRHVLLNRWFRHSSQEDLQRI